MSNGSKRSRDEMAAPVSQVTQASEIIENVQRIVSTVWLNKRQCKRIADRFKVIGDGLKGLDKDFVSGKPLDGSNVDYPAFDELLTVLRKGEALVSSNTGMYAIYTVLSRTDNREAFEVFHEELETMKAKFLFEDAGVGGDFELTTGPERSDILTDDADKDLEEMKGLKALQKSVDGLSPIDEVTQLSETLGAMNLEKVKKVLFEKSENREASDGLPSYLDIDMANIETDTQPIREHVRMSTHDPAETFSWALVRSGRWLGCEFAVKVFKSGESSWDRSQLAREVGNLMELRHPHIVRFIGFAQGADQCCVLMELMDSDLKTFMTSRPQPPFSHSEELSIITQIAKGMLYLHTQGYVHEELKCSNILVKSYGDYIEVKIGDLRNARKLASIGDQYSSHCSRRPRWTALEAIKNYNGEKPSDEMLRKSDVYCFAMTCYEVVTGKLPFQDIRGRALMAKIEAGERPELPADLDEGWRGLITTCWDSDPSKRPEFEDICHVLGIIRSSKPHVASNGTSLGTESKMLRLLKHGSLNTWVFPRVISAVSGLFVGVQSKQQAATKTPVISQEESVENMPVVSQEESVENMDVDGPSGIRIPEYLRIKPAALHKGRCIGSGASAEVWEVMWLGCKFAMKTFQSSTPIPALQSELDFLIQLRHPYIIQMVGLSVQSDQRCSIVMEFMGGSLRKLIRSRMEQKRVVLFDVHEALGIIRKIALGMAFLHSRGVLHRDLKGENVLCQEYADSIDVKIVDFGVSQYIQGSSGDFSLSVGTKFWRAPEIFPLEANRSRTSCDLKKADVYSFAMTCYEVLTGNVPFAERRATEYDAVLSGLRPELPLNLDSGLKALIAKCWHTDPEERPHFSQICDELHTIHQTLQSSTS
ncbi:hypothetical protein KC19_1G158100 [Ceratodon purpureus]|uniref:Protein kinase domain-containing protein n=1 Tax=Ceratodon purpureus TaxID=3225 RepID=A0A8T0J8N9_CERPU|nr:hypothetical protein KC19_1G158100 [Ceratodon purpureus]